LPAAPAAVPTELAAAASAGMMAARNGIGLPSLVLAAIAAGLREPPLALHVEGHRDRLPLRHVLAAHEVRDLLRHRIPMRTRLPHHGISFPAATFFFSFFVVCGG